MACIAVNVRLSLSRFKCILGRNRSSNSRLSLTNITEFRDPDTLSSQLQNGVCKITARYRNPWTSVEYGGLRVGSHAAATHYGKLDFIHIILTKHPRFNIELCYLDLNASGISSEPDTLYAQSTQSCCNKKSLVSAVPLP